MDNNESRNYDKALQRDWKAYKTLIDFDDMKESIKVIVAKTYKQAHLDGWQLGKGITETDARRDAYVGMEIEETTTNFGTVRYELTKEIVKTLAHHLIIPDEDRNGYCGLADEKMIAKKAVGLAEAVIEELKK